jgi:sortase B
MNKSLRILLIVLLSALMLFSLGRIGMIQWSNWKAEKLYEELRAQSVRIETPPVAQEIEEDVFPEVHIDLDALQATNSEVVAWLWIPETEINYPILRGTDNQKYLTRNYQLKYDASGSIFMDFRNSAEFSDDNTILYGHNMKHGAMFGGLKKYGDAGYREDHPYIYVFTREGTMKYEIFAAYKTESTSRSYTREFFENAEEFLAYIALSAGGNLTQLPGEGTRLLTLSTCTSVRKTERFVIHGALVDTESWEAAQG